MQSDPEAAKIVFESGAPVTMVPLEVTHTALATPGVLHRLSARSTPFLGLMRKLLLFFAQTYREVFSFEHPPLHDPLAVFYVACPEAFKACFPHTHCFMWVLCRVICAAHHSMHAFTWCAMKPSRRAAPALAGCEASITVCCVNQLLGVA